MFEKISSDKLADGRQVNIYRLVTPEPNIPDKVIRYFMGSFSYDNYRQYYQAQTYWRLYYRESLAGNNSDYTVDHHYLAEVDGVFASRMWFAYNKAFGQGNFGNVYTEEAYRKNGLMYRLLEPCIKDFWESPAQMITCISGNPTAVKAYLKYGFKLIYGGEKGALCLSKMDFFEEQKKAFPGNEPLTVRPGNPGDQFDLDKFMAFGPAFYGQTGHGHTGFGNVVEDFRTAYQEVLSGYGLVNVAVTPSQRPVGFAYALNCYGNHVFDFIVHPAYAGQTADLLRKTAAEYEAKNNQKPLLSLLPDQPVRQKLVEDAGFHKVADVMGKYSIWAL